MKDISYNSFFISPMFRRCTTRKHLLLIMIFLMACGYGCKKQCYRCISESGFSRNDTIKVVFYDTALHRYDTLTKIDTINRLVDFSVLSLCPGDPNYNEIYSSPGGTNYYGWGYTDPSGRIYGCF